MVLQRMGSPFKKAPPPRVAENISPRDGIYTTPARGPLLSSAPIDTAQAGRSYKKLVVPSIGSMYQVMPLVPAIDAPSSPTMASSGRRSRMPSTMNFSDARSNSVTMSVAVDFVCTLRRPALRPASAISPAARASSLATRSNSSARFTKREFPYLQVLAIHQLRAVQALQQRSCRVSR